MAPRSMKLESILVLYLINKRTHAHVWFMWKNIHNHVVISGGVWGWQYSFSNSANKQVRKCHAMHIY